MKQHGATAKRYAKALFLVANESGQVEAVGRELVRFREVLAGERRLEEFLLRPWVKGATKQAVVGAVSEQLRHSKLVRNFLGLLAARGRTDHLPEIAEAYRDLQDAAEGRVRAQVKSAVALGAQERERLAARLARVMGKEVILEESVDPSLLGGFVARIGSLVLDGSVDGQLARLRERLVRG